MIDLTLIGIGTGNPDHMTLQAIEAMRHADLILIPLKGAEKSDLAGLRRKICADHLAGAATRVVEFQLPVRDADHPNYHQGVDDWHDAIADAWLDHIDAVVGQHGRVALLIWGDPSLYDSSLRIAQRLGRVRKTSVNVVPGITAIGALCAAHAIPLNTIGAPVTITTGRQIRDHGWPDGADTVVVMLDGACAFQSLDPQGIEIWWGGFVGMKEQILRAGPLADLAPQIIEARAAARAQHGWIMDIYLMRRNR
ncbi:precorrin-6A synthase (deacetylating) [Thioclava sp. SK-1]|uniref:precorrin-6A synthase (deacetylating) n=1 Tax=Thioclava sp. SK-1 TaxID=1889770 RepID=UPI0008257F1A|nr:precorrin-6A synthase (deacetylating) [Thioclava sp. SK-1]OCX65997.1 precorrin-6A synthase (deacetylating) [Thioclava sp. SK-1]